MEFVIIIGVCHNIQWCTIQVSTQFDGVHHFVKSIAQWHTQMERKMFVIRVKLLIRQYPLDCGPYSGHSYTVNLRFLVFFTFTYIMSMTKCVCVLFLQIDVIRMISEKSDLISEEYFTNDFKWHLLSNYGSVRIF